MQPATLSDEGFAKVLAFTRQSFEMALHFAAEQEQITLAKLKKRIPKTDARDAMTSNSSVNGTDSTQPQKKVLPPPHRITKIPNNSDLIGACNVSGERHQKKGREFHPRPFKYHH